MSKKIKINIVSLGCSKNTVDSEKLAGQLVNEGFEVYFNIEKLSFDFVIINTCGFIDKAKEESINIILSFCDFRQRTKKTFKIIVYGCLAARYKNEMNAEISEIDALFGIMQESKIIDYIKQNIDYNNKNIDNQNKELCSANENNYAYDNLNKNCIAKADILTQYTDRKLSTSKHYAYLKISEGCDRRCSFCAIPLIKGRHISRPIEDIVNEAKNLIKQGVKELILIAQDTSYYGLDLYKKRRLKDLLTELCKTDIEWIRLQYSYPNEFPVEILDLMKENSKLCHYIDMPLQHINDRILHSMNRNITGNEVVKLIKNIRNKVPDIAFRTTLLVGYPTETEDEFNELKSFVKEAQFDRMGAFTYSKEEGTKAAFMNDSLTQEEKLSRLDELTDIQQEISFNLNQKKIGKTFKTLIDGIEGEYYIGRTQYDSPEVDNEVLINISQAPRLCVGNFYNVLITDAVEFDLYGIVAKDKEK